MDTEHSNDECYDVPTMVSVDEGPRAADSRGSDFKNKYNKTFVFDYRSRKYRKFVPME